MMNDPIPNADLLARISDCVERGKTDADATYPPQMRGQPGAFELTRLALDEGTPAKLVLEHGLIAGMNRVGENFRAKRIFVPDVLLAARAMNAAMTHLKPYFQSSELERRGVFVIGTVRGDLHDIGKKLVSMIVEGAGWEVRDLGIDVMPERFAEEVSAAPGCVVGLSALLTTTMLNMQETISVLRAAFPAVPVIVGGAPVTEEFAFSIGADAYGADPQSAVDFLLKTTGGSGISPP